MHESIKMSLFHENKQVLEYLYEFIQLLKLEVAMQLLLIVHIHNRKF